MTWLAALLFLAASPTGQSENQQQMVISIGDQTPFYHQCFDNAEDGLTSYDALEPCDRSLEEEPLSPRKTAILYANRGVIHFHLGDYEAAVDDFTMALDFGIHVEARVYANRGLSYEALHDDALARSDYDKALAINPNNRIARHRLEQLDKPLYDRARLPKRIQAEISVKAEPGV